MKLSDLATDMRRDVALKKISSEVVRNFKQGSSIFRTRDSTPEVDVVYCTLLAQGGPYADEWDEEFYRVTWTKFLKALFEKSFPGEQVEIDAPISGINVDKKRELKTTVRLHRKISEDTKPATFPHGAACRHLAAKLSHDYNLPCSCFNVSEANSPPYKIKAVVETNDGDVTFVLATLPKLITKLSEEFFYKKCTIAYTKMNPDHDLAICVFTLEE